MKKEQYVIRTGSEIAYFGGLKKSGKDIVVIKRDAKVFENKIDAEYIAEKFGGVVEMLEESE